MTEKQAKHGAQQLHYALREAFRIGMVFNTPQVSIKAGAIKKRQQRQASKGLRIVDVTKPATKGNTAPILR